MQECRWRTRRFNLGTVIDSQAADVRNVDDGVKLEANIQWATCCTVLSEMFKRWRSEDTGKPNPHYALSTEVLLRVLQRSLHCCRVGGVLHC